MGLSLKLTIFSLLYVFLLANEKIKNLGDWTFDYYTKNSDRRWLVYFYADFCGHCRNFQINVMDKLDWDESKAYIGKVSCGEFRSTCLYRFGIEYIPKLYLIENNTLYDFPFSSLSTEYILESLTIPLDSSKGRPIPMGESLITTIARDCHELLEKIHNKVDRFLNERFSGSVDWYNINYTLGILAGLSFIGLILVFLILRSLFRCCCRVCCRKRNVPVKQSPVETTQENTKQISTPDPSTSEKKQQ